MLTVAVGGWPHGVVLACLVGTAAWFLARRATRRRSDTDDALRIAASWDLLAASLQAGLPVPTALRAIASGAPHEPAAALRSTADLVVLGAAPSEAWAPARACAQTAELARAAGRSAQSGTALAAIATDLARRVRAGVDDAAEAKAQRAGVLITGPLGLCFLPSFLCLGVVPVVVGLASQLTVMG